MNKNIRRFATILTLTAVLGSTPAFAGPSRDGGGAPDRPGIIRIVQKLMQKLFGLQPLSGPSIPIPGPNTNG